MSKFYYISYVVTGSKGLQKKLLEIGGPRNLKSFVELFDVSFFLSFTGNKFSAHSWKNRQLSSERIKFLCWNYVDESGEKHYIEKISRALVFNKKRG